MSTFNWGNTTSKVAQTLRKYGTQVTLLKADTSTAKAFGIWDSNLRNEQGNPTTIISGQRQIYLPGNMRKIPAPGDYIREGNSDWHITEVEAYKPAATVIAYRCLVS